MSTMTYEEFTQRIQQHFAEQTYADGLALASEQVVNFPEEFPTINYYRICLASRMGEFAIANKILESTLASGIWYSEMILRQSPSLEPLQGQEEFERLAAISAKMIAVDGLAQMPMLVVRPENACGPDDEGCPAVLFLHGNFDTAQKNLEQWRHLPEKGWLAAFPQSRQAMFPGSFHWTDYETTLEEIYEHYEGLTANYSLDLDRLIVGGFSMGGEMALTMALTGDLPARGFILLGPGGPDIANLAHWQALIEKAQGKNLRGVILMGEADDSIPREEIVQLVDLLNDHGILCLLKSFPGLEHAYPPDFVAVADEAIDFILAD